MYGCDMYSSDVGNSRPRLIIQQLADYCISGEYADGTIRLWPLLTVQPDQLLPLSPNPHPQAWRQSELVTADRRDTPVAMPLPQGMRGELVREHGRGDRHTRRRGRRPGARPYVGEGAVRNHRRGPTAPSLRAREKREWEINVAPQPGGAGYSRRPRPDAA